MIRAGHVARMRNMKYAYNILVGEHEGKRPFEDLSNNGKIILQ
jgi:hypothetical protein